MKTLEELKKELERVAMDQPEPNLGCLHHSPEPDPREDRDAYERWWRLVIDGGPYSSSPPPVVVQAPRVFYDSPKGLVPVYSGIRKPLFVRQPDGHLGAVEI